MTQIPVSQAVAVTLIRHLSPLADEYLTHYNTNHFHAQIFHMFTIL